MRRVLTKKRLLCLFGEIGGDFTPALDVASVALTIADLITALKETATELSASKAAIEFLERGPPSLGDLVVDAEEVFFPSYSAFVKLDLEKRYGAAGEGYEYHHIVERGTNASRFTPQELQSTGNIIRIPRTLQELGITR